MPPSDLGDTTLKEALDRLEQKYGLRLQNKNTLGARQPA
jgi:hypothetical protein